MEKYLRGGGMKEASSVGDHLVKNTAEDFSCCFFCFVFVFCFILFFPQNSKFALPGVMIKI